MSKGKCKFYNGKWHLVIKNELTNQIFSDVIPFKTISDCFSTGCSVDAIAWSSGYSQSLKYFCHTGFASVGGGWTSTLQVFFTRKNVGIEWEIKNDPHTRWSDYHSPRRVKLKRNEELVSFVKDIDNK